MYEPADGQLGLGTACGSGNSQVTDLMSIRKFGNPPSTCVPIGGVMVCEPQDLKKRGSVIPEFYGKSQSSEELIFAQIEWASAGAEWSRLSKDQERQAMKRTFSTKSNKPHHNGNDLPIELTMEKFLAALLQANAELVEALKQYEDLEKVAME
ncbi:uncharacterized protein LACBIDRAFT_319062 [Laccaria bicolor S238N-H82]|uniref:Predicted protein n=1 Tax=Laccaria bicolor (strain S238N-H82 / ATCC MYA-4686) TaxID=486041 RepID=B0D7S3_LACBS|nr:uncharacterized protein LACBIDRAFT_319062 [Laccaria bicolor S238N-H82]EDR09699.1 predicted protein [Laccaria bicolor S238N-H82]|eukprot:XP_001880048.1 predicted protein [Laccaria bicolor S238N-H82]